MKHLPEILGFLSWVVVIIASYNLTVMAANKFDKKQASNSEKSLP
jgi:hypothetical protein